MGSGLPVWLGSLRQAGFHKGSEFVVVQPHLVIFLIQIGFLPFFPLFFFFPFFIFNIEIVGARIRHASDIRIDFDCSRSTISIIEENTINIMATDTRHDFLLR
jgi:hypothetical protein